MFTRNTNEIIIKTEQTKKCNKSCRVEVKDWNACCEFLLYLLLTNCVLKRMRRRKNERTEWMYWIYKIAQVFGRMEVERKLKKNNFKEMKKNEREMMRWRCAKDERILLSHDRTQERKIIIGKISNFLNSFLC